jgi:DNA-binding NarL/FixJ family response regulator
MHDERVTTVSYVPVVGVYQAVTDGAIRLAMRLGVRGLLSRPAMPTRLAESITRVADGEIFLDGPALQQLLHAGVGGRLAAAEADRERYRLLSNREAEIFVRLARGMNSRTIARELGISAKTVETHQSHVYQKLGVGSAVELFHIALRLGLEEMNGA